MKKVKTVEIEEYFCDITGKEITDEDYFWVSIESGNGVLAEYWSPFHLCPKYRDALYTLFTRNMALCEKEGFVYERYSGKTEVTPELVERFKDVLEDEGLPYDF